MSRLAPILALLSLARAQDTAPSGGELKIIGPESVRAHWPRATIEASPALFGIPVYNGQFVGSMHHDASNANGCNKFADHTFQSDPLDEKTKKIAILSRGDCTFVQKVFNAQEAGAKGVVVYNNMAGDVLPIMADDGTGDRVAIPSIIISLDDGSYLRDQVTNPLIDVEVEISWGLPRPDGRVEWEFWITADMTSREKQFVKDFTEVITMLGPDAHLFTPHYNIANGMMEASDKDCTNDRKYCVFGWNGVDGSLVIKESLTQQCVWDWGQANNKNTVWWKYVDAFNDECTHGDMEQWRGPCSDKVLGELEAKEGFSGLKAAVSKCAFDSGGVEGPTNSVFEDEIKAFTDFGIYWIPTITINNEKYHGNLLCPNPVDISTCSVFAAICAGFAPETIPSACNHRHAGCPMGQTRDTCGVCGGDGTSCKSATKALAGGFIAIIALIIMIALAGMFYLRSRLQSTEEQFDALRSMYEPLRDSENPETRAWTSPRSGGQQLS